MPMLTTLRMRFPVWPFHAPLRTRSANSLILSSTAWTCGTTFSPSTMIDAPFGARSATWSTARCSVTLIFSPRNMASIARAQAGLLRQLQQQLDGLVGDAILRVVEVDPGRIDGHALAPLGIFGEQGAQMQAQHFLVVGLQGLPRRALG